MKTWWREAAEAVVFERAEPPELARRFAKSQRHIYDILKHPEFTELVSEYERQRASTIAVDLSAVHNRLISKSWAALESVLDDPTAPHTARVTAATSILKGLGQFTERQEHTHNMNYGVIVIDGPDEGYSETQAARIRTGTAAEPGKDPLTTWN